MPLIEWLAEEPNQNERQRILNGQAINRSRLKKWFMRNVIFLNLGGGVQKSAELIMKVFIECTEKDKEDKECIGQISYMSGYIGFAIATALITLKTATENDSTAQKTLSVIFRSGGDFAFLYQLVNYMLSTSYVDDRIAIAYTVGVGLFVIISNPVVRQLIKKALAQCGLNVEHVVDWNTQTQDNRSLFQCIFVDPIFRAGDHLNFGVNFIVGVQDLVAAIQCESRSKFFKYPWGLVRWIPPIVFSPVALYNGFKYHPVMPEGIKPRWLRYAANFKQAGGFFIFFTGLVMSVVTAMRCSDEVLHPAIKTGLYGLVMLLLSIYTCCYENVSGQRADVDDQHDGYGTFTSSIGQTAHETIVHQTDVAHETAKHQADDDMHDVDLQAADIHQASKDMFSGISKLHKIFNFLPKAQRPENKNLEKSKENVVESNDRSHKNGLRSRSSRNVLLNV